MKVEFDPVGHADDLLALVLKDTGLADNPNISAHKRIKRVGEDDSKARTVSDATLINEEWELLDKKFEGDALGSPFRGEDGKYYQSVHSHTPNHWREYFPAEWKEVSPPTAG